MSSPIKKILLNSILFYKKRISRLKRKPCCRFYPSCSTYACQAITKYGAVKGTGKSIWRILRCNPLSKGGYDPMI